MASSTQDEQVHHRIRMEEDALYDEDLNNEAKHEDDDKMAASESETNEAEKQKVEPEAKHEDDDKMAASESETSEPEKQKVEPEAKYDDAKKIVASESATSEQEVKDDANQEDESRGGTMTMPTTTPPRSLTQEEEELREKEARASAILVSLHYDAVPPKNPSVLEIDDHEEDDSEQTLRFLTRWKAPDVPPNKTIHHLIEQCSRPIQKQLTTSDVNSRKLSLPRKKFQQLLDETEAARGRKEARVSVYGPDGVVHEMWVGDKEERSSFELTLGWRKFVVDYGLKECCDFIMVWMFRHRDTQGICLAVDAIRFSFRKEVSKRISQAAFEDAD